MMNDQPSTTPSNGDGRSNLEYPRNPSIPPRPEGSRIHERHIHEGRPQESIPGLMRGLADDVTTLFSKEMSLAKAELREAAAEAKAGVASLGIGAGLAISGVFILLMSAVYGLANFMELWLAALIVGAAALLIGFIAVKSAQKKMEPAAFKPERTIESMHRDKEAAERAVK